MSVLAKIAFYQGIRDEVPNQLLARELAETHDTEGIKEIAEHLRDKNTNVCSDCIKVLYEVGYLDPGLITPYVDDFLKLLSSRQNRMVWGAMISLSTIASHKADELFAKREMIYKAIDQGSVITQDNGIKSLSLVAATNSEFLKELSPYLMAFIRACRLSDLPRHAEFISICVNDSNKEEFTSILQNRMSEMKSSQFSRIKKVLKNLE